MAPSSPRSGILLVDKPGGLSSAEVLNRIKRRHKVARIGHGGTLDPFATGLMVALLGEATKIARFLLEGEKEYEAIASLGTETDTGDLTGKLVRSAAAPSLSLSRWQELATPFVGRIRQTPPAFSAIKVKGRPLYDYARKGEAVEVKSRDVVVKELEVLEAESGSLRFRVRCGGGTYIRVLASDLASAAGSAAHLSSLRRLASSSFRVERALPLEQILEREELPLLPLQEGLSHLPRVDCEPAQAERVRQGNLAIFTSLKSRLEKPGYFLLMEGGKPVAVCNHNPMLVPFCSIERVFDPCLLGP
jgi:tRNA pseudouridine55 synthase